MPDVVSVNPATLEENGRVPAASPEEVRNAVRAARVAQPGWAALGLEARMRVLKRYQALLVDRKREVAELVTRESGKPLGEALVADVLPALEAVRWLEGEGVAFLKGERFRNHILIAKDRESVIRFDPRGVVGIIAPWNYPLGIAAAQIAFALLAGNAVVLKPATQTTLTALRLAGLFHEAGVPHNALRVVPGPGHVVGKALHEADIDFLVFTGSVPVGRAVDASCRARGVPTCMELGGSDPAIVLADADLDLAANGIAWGRFTNAGQTCAAVKRVLVEDAAHDGLAERLAAHASRLRVGNGMDADVDVGPLVSAGAVKDMEAFVADAVARGARVLAGGKPRRDLPGHFFEPTVLVDVPPDARALREEVFGPVLPVVRVKDADEAVRRANDSPFGLGASVWTRDTRKGERLAAALDCGTVTLNDGLYTFALMETPWMGRKDSGHGITHGRYGLLEMVTVRHVNVAPGRRPLAEPWWFPYSARDADTWSRAIEFLYGGAGAKARHALPLTGRLLRKRNL